ncbi:MAG TPA: hypothetical protein VGF33_00130 [Caulobacteraceae bacterium]|jgi:hypothetical protein
MKSLVAASLAVLIGASAMWAVTATPASAYRYYHRGHYYPYRWHGGYYGHRRCYAYHHCRYW